MDGIQLVVSMVSGGLAGAGVSAMSNRMAHWRILRTQFEPQVNDLFASYVIRLEIPERRYWTGIVGHVPPPEDKVFVNKRADFIMNLVQFSELKEARILRHAILDNHHSNSGAEGEQFRVDLLPEYQAVSACLTTLHSKLKLK